MFSYVSYRWGKARDLASLRLDDAIMNSVRTACKSVPTRSSSQAMVSSQAMYCARLGKHEYGSAGLEYDCCMSTIGRK